MEFNEKLRELRKNRSLTQEELADALFVSRTAVSKWESGRGYPSIDSLKEISKYFGITLDELICADELISVAENEKKEYTDKYITLICCAIDMLLSILLLVPAFGNGTGSEKAVTLFEINGVSLWIKTVFIAIIVITILNGFCGVIIVNFNKPVWNKHRLVTGLGLSVLAVAIFIVSRQPYAGIVCFSMFVIKEILMICMRKNNEHN